jgi:hypothetical protein
MQTLGIDEETIGKQVDPSAPHTGFWKRQFQQEPTKAQKRFDWIFGVAMPAICFYFDPIVFQRNEVPALYKYKVGVYVLTYVSIMGLAAWLLWKEKLGWLLGPLAGLFAAGSVIALVIGIVIFPLSLLGLMILIGALGFTPLFTSVIYARNAVRAIRATGPFLENGVALHAMILSGMLALVVPYVINIAMTDRSSGLWNLMSAIYGWIL